MPGADSTTRRVPVVTPFGRQVRFRDAWRGPFLSAVLHVLLILAMIWAGERAVDAMRNPGEGAGPGGGGGGGGNRTFAVLLPGAALAEPVPEVVEEPPPPEVLVLPATPVVAPQAPVESTVVAAPSTQVAAGPGTGAGTGPGADGGSGGGSGGGVGTGRGTGTGPDSGGAGGQVFPPQPQGIILPPDGAPRELRGVELTVSFDINERGDVVGVEVEPAIRNRGYRNDFVDRMRRYTFTPAHTRDGRRVRAPFIMQITL